MERINYLGRAVASIQASTEDSNLPTYVYYLSRAVVYALLEIADAIRSKE